MSEERSLPQIATPDLHRKLDDLERRTTCLKDQYDSLIARAGDLEKWTTAYVSRIERERRVAAIVELLMRRDNRSKLLLDYICVFFEIVLKKMQKTGAPLYTSKDLWLGLTDESVQKLFTITTQKLGFTRSEQGALILVFEVVHDRDFSAAETCQSMALAIAKRRQEAEEISVFDSDVASLFLYLQIQDELQTSVRAGLRRAVAVAHCGLMGTQDRETNLDISNMTAQDLVSKFLTSTPKPTATSMSTSTVRSPDSDMPISKVDIGVRGVQSDHQYTSPGTSEVTKDMNDLSLNEKSKETSSHCNSICGSECLDMTDDQYISPGNASAACMSETDEQGMNCEPSDVCDISEDIGMIEGSSSSQSLTMTS